MKHIYWIVLGAIMVVLSSASAASAQTNPCLGLEFRTTEVNKSFVMCWTFDGLDDNKNPVVGPVTWKIYRNNVLIAPGAVFSAAITGATDFWVNWTETVAGTVNYAVSAVTAAGEGRKIPFLSLSVLPAQAVASPSRPRIVAKP